MRQLSFVFCLTAAVSFMEIGLCLALEMGESNRDTIVSRMREFLEIPLSTNRQHDWECLTQNLDRDEYRCPHCNCNENWPVDPQPCRSDILAHQGFLNGAMAHTQWQGMNYLFGGADTPDLRVSVQDRVDQCAGLGAHHCHYSCGNSSSWAIGADCSAAVSYAGNVTRGSTVALDSDDYGVVLPWSSVKEGAYVVKSQVHVVLVESRSGQTIQILEQTGSYPVGRRVSRSISYYQDRDYTPRDFCAVASAQGSDGKLVARIIGDAVRLSWRVDSAGDARWYEFQRLDPGGETWVTLRQADFRGPGMYEFECAPGPAGALFRVLETECDGASVEHTGSFALVEN